MPPTPCPPTNALGWHLYHPSVSEMFFSVHLSLDCRVLNLAPQTDSSTVMYRGVVEIRMILIALQIRDKKLLFIHYKYKSISLSPPR